MARPPRGGFRPSDVRGTLGSLIKSTLAQAGVVRDVLERGAREGRSRLDEVRAGRRRQDALAELGEAVLELIRRGEIDLGELPEVRDVVADLDELDAAAPPRRGKAAWADKLDELDDEGMTETDRRRHAGGLGDIARPSSRQRFDDRGSAAGGSAAGRGMIDDGTVSSGAAPRVWRPPVGDGGGEAARPAKVATPTIPSLPKAIARAHKGGGITFDDDDLADYMHPDDVPSKPPRDES